MHEHVFDPLDVTDTGFVRCDEMGSRLVACYTLGSCGVEPVAGYEAVAGVELLNAAGHGLYAAALLAGGGEQGAVIEPATLATMFESTTNRICTSLVKGTFSPGPSSAKPAAYTPHLSRCATPNQLRQPPPGG